MQLHYDPQADAIYVRFAEPETSVRTERLDRRRLIDYDEQNEPVGVEFLSVSEGIEFAGIPRANEIREALHSLSSLAPA